MSIIAPLLALLATATLVQAQVGRTIPGVSYFEAIEEIYRADYQQATRALQNEVRGSVKFSIHNRWVDSICFHTMLGEALYQQGRYAAALEQLDRALELFEAQATWLNTINFQQQPRPNPNRGRRLPIWARSTRQVSYTEVPSSFLVAIGQIDNTAAAQQGGVIQQAQFWKLDAQEVARSVAWAIYRRGKILGPLAAYDRLQSRLAERIARGGLGPARHWSNAWVELWWGVAAASLGDRKQAEPHLMRATLIDGHNDHAMTGLALLVRGQLALEAGDPNAAVLLNDAVVASLAYEDYPTLDEATRFLHLQHITQVAKEPHPLIEPLSVAAVREGLAHIAIGSSLWISESLLSLRQTDAALQRMNNLFRRQREAEQGMLGIESARLKAISLAQQEDRAEALRVARNAIVAKRNASLRNFQIGLANLWYDNGLLTPRIAPEVYSVLLGEPTSSDWLEYPLDTITAQGTDHSAALERWFLAEVSKNNAKGALIASEVAKRRKFFNSQTLAGRLVGLRRLLESRDEDLSVVERQLASSLLDSHPRYANALEADRAARRALSDDAMLFTDEADAAQRKILEKLERSTTAREAILVDMSLSRAPTMLAYPTPLDLESARSHLAEGEAVIVFHQTSRELFGMLLVSEGEDLWTVGLAKDIRGQAAQFLKQVAGVSPQQKWEVDQLAQSTWREPSRELSDMLFSPSRLDFGRVKKITIVPDSVLWHVPFEALQTVGSNRTGELLIDLAPVRYSPTVGSALSPRSPQRIVKYIAWNAPPSEDSQQTGAMSKALSKAVRIDARLSAPRSAVKAMCQRMVVSSDMSLDPNDPFGIELWNKRGKGNDLREWVMLPHRGPDMLVFDQMHTVAERALKTGRRSSDTSSARLGDEVFLAACSALAPGTQSLLLTRWSTRGRNHEELISEYLTGASEMSPSEAWRRSVRLARPMKLNINREARLEDPSDDGQTTPPDASHPFFWAGYMVVE